MISLRTKYPITIIDVRSEQEYYEGHIDGAINIPLSNIKKQIINVVKDKDAIIVVYCSAGIRSRKAQEILSLQGYSNVYNLI